MDTGRPGEGAEPPVGVSADARGAPTDRLAERRLLLAGLARTLLTVVAVLVLYYVLPFDRDFGGRTVLTLVTGFVAIGILIVWQVRAILRAQHPALRAVEALALSLPLFVLLFAAAYFVMGSDDPGAFNEPLSRTDSLYFVVTVFATVGFGDIHAVSEPARVLVTVQMVLDLVLIGLVLRLFVAAVDRGRKRTSRGS
jgi:hypothetical protein